MLQDFNTIHRKSNFREIGVLQGFLILCLISVIGLNLLPTIIVLAKVEKDAAPVNDSAIKTLNNKGLTLEKLGNYTGAIYYYNRALTIHANDTYTLNNIGMVLDDLGNYTGAIYYYNKVLAIKPNNTHTLDNIGMALNNLGNYTGAVDYFNRALAIDPNDEAALYNKGAALDHLGFPTF